METPHEPWWQDTPKTLNFTPPPGSPMPAAAPAEPKRYYFASTSYAGFSFGLFLSRYEWEFQWEFIVTQDDISWSLRLWVLGITGILQNDGDRRTFAGRLNRFFSMKEPLHVDDE